jgi:hypothetical protein
MYTGKKLAKEEVSLVFIHEKPSMYFTAVDGKPVDFFPDGLKLEFQPGRHVFEVNVTTHRAYAIGSVISETARYTVGSYRLELDLLPGYTYALDFHYAWTPQVQALPEQLCFLGEPHDAPGSSVNFTGEFRVMSQSAQRFGCAKAHSVADK